MARRGSSNYAGQIGWAVGLPEWLNDKSSSVERYWRVIEEGSAATKWPWQDQGIAGLWGDAANPRMGTADSPFNPGIRTQGFEPYFRKREGDMLKAARGALRYFLGGGKGKNMDLLKVEYVKIYRRQWLPSDRRREGGKGRATGPVAVKTHTFMNPSDFKRARRALYHWYMHNAESPNQLPFVYGTIRRPISGKDYYGRAMKSFRTQLPAMQAEAIRQALGYALASGSGSNLQRLRKIQQFDSFANTPSRKGPARAERRVADLRKYAPFGSAIQVGLAEVTIQDSIRNAKGQFTSFQSSLREANELIAIRYQTAVADLIRGEGHRPPTDALVRATMNARNRYPRDKG